MLFFLLLINVLEVLASTDLPALAESPQWRLLLHYPEKKSPYDKSRIEESSLFFLSPKGQTDPLAELNQTLRILRDPDVFLTRKEGHPYCLFPARVRFLSEKLKEIFPKVNCPALEDWRGKTYGEEVRLAYASQFASNPASVMGHTFLVFRQKDVPEFLHMSVGYAANIPDDEAALSYIVNGLGGGFPGFFVEAPFYEKVQEYNNIEQRALWQFTLKLSDLQRQFLADHLWELKHTAKLDYYFLDENCSYLLLAVIEATVPGSKLTSDFSIYVIPHETIKTLDRAGLITETEFRPPLRDQLISSYEGLNSRERQVFHAKLAGEKLQGDESVKLLGALMHGLSLKRQRQEGKFTKEQYRQWEELLLARSQFAIHEEFTPVQSEKPLESHGTKILDASFGETQNLGGFFEIGLRLGVHLESDKPTGFLPHSAFSFLYPKFRIYQLTDELELQDFILFNLRNTSPWLRVDPQWSWKSQLGWYVNRDQSCLNCKSLRGILGLGKAFEIKNDWFTTLMVNGETQVSHRLPKGQRSWLGLENEYLYSTDRRGYSLSVGYGRNVSDLEMRERLKVAGEARWFDVIPHWTLGLKLDIATYGGEVLSQREQSVRLSHDF